MNNKNLNHCELTASITAAANIIARDLPDGQLNLLAAMLMQLADTLATIAVVRDINADTGSGNSAAPKSAAAQETQKETSSAATPQDSAAQETQKETSASATPQDSASQETQKETPAPATPQDSALPETQKKTPATSEKPPKPA